MKRTKIPPQFKVVRIQDHLLRDRKWSVVDKKGAVIAQRKYKENAKAIAGILNSEPSYAEVFKDG